MSEHKMQELSASVESKTYLDAMSSHEKDDLEMDELSIQDKPLIPKATPENKEVSKSPANAEIVPPLPWKQLILVFCMYIVDIFSFSTLMPYIAPLVRDLNLVPDGDSRKIGYYASLIGSSYYAAQFASAFFWGMISDKYGRRVVLLTGILGGCITSFLFGFSKSLIWAMGTRILFGLVNGNLGAYKVYISEISHKKHHPRVFSYISLAVSVGTVFGPIVGGFLSNPVDQYSSLFASFPTVITRTLSYYPFLLPNLLVSSIQLVSFTIAFKYLTESNEKVLEKKMNGFVPLTNQSTKRKNNKITFVNDELELDDKPSKEVNDDVPLIVNSHIQLKPDLRSRLHQLFTLGKGVNIPTAGAPLIVSMLYALIGFNNIVFAECSPLLMILSADQGGLNFKQKQIGIASSITGLMMIVFQLFFCHKIMYKYGLLKSFKYCSYILVPLVPLYPMLSHVANYPFILWSSLIVLNFFRFAAIQTSFSACNVMLNNSVLPQNRGKLNGFAQSLVALARTLAPLLGIVFALTLSINVFPFNVYFTYMFMSVLHLASAGLTMYLTPEIDEPKTPQRS